MKMKMKIDTTKKYKICPKCHKLYRNEDNYCSNEKELVKLLEVEFI